MKWILPVVLLVAACGSKRVVTEVTTTTTAPAAAAAVPGQTAPGAAAGQAAAGGAVEGAGVVTSVGERAADPAIGLFAAAVTGAYFACLSDEQREVVGQPLDEVRAVLPPDLRIIPPGAVVTQEYLPNRVNVDIDSRSVITRVWCG